jgi:hypothetical protein
MDFVHGGRDRPEKEQPVRSEGKRSAGVGGVMPESLDVPDCLVVRLGQSRLPLYRGR